MSPVPKPKTRRSSALTRYLLGGAIVVVAAVFIFRGRPGQSRFTSRSGPSGSITESATRAPRPIPDELVVTRDPAAVFQRAFWRRPASDSRVLHGERREWLDGTATVQKWEWHVAVQTSAAFRAWLIDQNPLEISRATTPIDAAEATPAPDWFPAPSTWTSFVAYRSRGSKLIVLLDPASGRLFAADHGAGFAPPTR